MKAKKKLAALADRIETLTKTVSDLAAAKASASAKWPRDPSWSITGNPSLISWGPTYREALLFVFRGAMNCPGLPLANIMAYCNPNVDCTIGALSAALRYANFEGSEADAILATINELIEEGTVEGQDGAFRLTNAGFKAALVQRTQIEALMKANAEKMAEIKSRPVPEAVRPKEA